MLLPFLDGEGDHELAVRRVARVRSGRIAVAEASEVFLDAVRRVLEEIFVDRSFALDGNEIRAHAGRDGVAGPHDADVRAGIDGERQLRDPFALFLEFRSEERRV